MDYLGGNLGFRHEDNFRIAAIRPGRVRREIRTAGASVVAVSVDAPDKSEALRVDLPLPFSLLCDTERRVVRDWGIYNSGEKGGIAKPAVFILTPAKWYVMRRWTRL